MIKKIAWRSGQLMAASSLLMLSLNVCGQSFSRTEVTTYFDDSARWVLGQVSSRSVDGLVLEQTSFSPALAAPEKRWNSGKIAWSLSYNANGTIATSTDGNGNTTAFGGWKLGIPQVITYADGTSQSAVVSGHGWITQVADENGHVTRYGYDPMGRLESIAYPGDDAVAWAGLSQAFVQVQTSEYGIDPGHWRQQTSTGNGRRVTYFDGLWQPLLMVEYDANNVAGTQRFSGFEYDHEGRVVFASYPSADSNPSQGVWTSYDGLGRTVGVAQDSELGVLMSTTAYLKDASGIYTLQRNARGSEVRTWYQVFDQPSYELPVRILQPEGVVTTISRDALGKPTAITRGAETGGVQISRLYRYNSAQELCASVEPESGTTLFGYDGAGNPAWSAAGLPPSVPCELEGNSLGVVSRRVARAYDNRNRLSTLTFPDGNGNQVWSYTPDGRPSRITTQDSTSSSPVINSYSYNKRRLLIAESAQQAGSYSWTLGYAYDGNGSLAGVYYPSGMYVDYAPNGLGQPTRAGPYANGVAYYPNGGMRRFVYGNGVVHEMHQNARQLPERVDEDAVLGNAYHYDKAGNVADIVDSIDASRTRVMSYDGLDRLTRAVSPSFGGTGDISYGFDAADNLRSVSLGGVRKHHYWYDSSNRLSNVVSDSGATVIGLSYDVQGNLANRNGQVFQFDYGNRLRAAVGKEVYRYDGHGRRTVSSLPGGGDIVSMYGVDGVLRRQDNQRTANVIEYVHLNGSLVAQVSASTAPAAPVLEVPTYSADGTFVVSWSDIVTATRFELQEQVDGGAWRVGYTGSGRSEGMTAKAAGYWSYRVRACRQSVCGGWSPVATVAVKVVPSGIPSISVPALSTSGAFNVSWTAVAGATSYRVEERVAGAAWTQLGSSSALYLGIGGRSAGNYSYRVSACNASGCGAAGGEGNVRVVLPPTSAPTLTVPVNSTDGIYTIGWPSVAAATSYRLEELSPAGGWTLLYVGGATSQGVAGRTNGTYQYRAVACNDGGCSDYSPVATIQVLLPPAGSPVLSLPSSNVSGDYGISWSVQAFATHYRLEESINGGAWMLIHDEGATLRSFTGRASAAYSYRVQACNASGCGGWSSQVTVSVLRIPPTPGNAYAMWDSPTKSQWLVTVRWGAAADATYYELSGYVVYSGPARTASKLVKSVNPPAGTQSFQVRACNASGCSAWSAVFYASA